jgi:trk system potassium uptake protein TrkA
VQEMAVPEEWNRRTLRELELRKRYWVAVVAVHDVLTDEMQVWPDPDTPLKDSDALLVAGRDDDLAKVAQLK